MQYWLDCDGEYLRKIYREKKAALQKPKFEREKLREIGWTDKEIDALKLSGDE